MYGQEILCNEYNYSLCSITKIKLNQLRDSVLCFKEIMKADYVFLISLKCEVPANPAIEISLNENLIILTNTLRNM